MAALSVQYSNLGICNFNFFSFAKILNLDLKYEFAETPPAIAISFIPV